MKIQFKHQPFQADAALAVTDVFKGQRIIANQARYKVDPGKGKQYLSSKQGVVSEQMLTNFDIDGWKNAPIQPEVRKRILKQIQEIQQRNLITPSQILVGEYTGKDEDSAKENGTINLTIEMETGVGKTYTYIKTIHELYKKYGWIKFMVVVPSIAIREGVLKSFKDLEEHFMLEYHNRIHFFVYNSSHLSDIDDFAGNSGIHVMIINSQAFARNFDENRNVEGRAGDNAARIIFTKQDSMSGRKPIDILAKTNPIIIIDEPQSLEGEATVNALKLFQPLFTLRYSATHRHLYNLIYRLDALDALRQKLVKKIAVKGISQSSFSGTDGFVFLEKIRTYTNKNPDALLRYDYSTASGIKQKTSVATRGFDLFQQSGNLPEYQNKGWIVTDIDAAEGWVEFQNNVRLHLGEVRGGLDQEMIRRIQIRETIKTHLQREEDLFKQGIKCLSLFFIDEVEKYKIYKDGVAQGGIYAQIFEEEYEALRQERLQQLKFNPEYMTWLAQQSASECHAGYFSIDKRTHQLVNPTVERRGRKAEASANSSDVDAFSLIMKGKEKLLSFDDPEGGKVRFIFSHSALREGWDNPNVFQICTLKQASAEIRKRQDVGRGLRLCVNKFGERQDLSVLGKSIYDVNILTVIASESYESFARALQDEIAQEIGDRPKKVEVSLFENATYLHKDGTKGNISQQLATNINFGLITNGYLDMNGVLTPKYFNDKAAGTFSLGQIGEQLDIQPESIVKILDRVFNPNETKPSDGNKEKRQIFKEERFNSTEFKKLWEQINSKSAYTVTFNSEELIQKAVAALNENLHVPAFELNITTGEVNLLAEETAMNVTERHHEKASLTVANNYRCDLIGEIVKATDLTRKDVATILTHIDEEVFNLFKQNPEAFIRNAATLINEQKASIVIEDITYSKIEEKFNEDIFSKNLLYAYPDSKQVSNTTKGIYDFFVLDSDVEVEFCKALETANEVKVYTKLPKGFFIKTPVGDYNPDWAIVFEYNGTKHIYFIAETKGSLSGFQLNKIEAAKIHCAKRHFKAISAGNIEYHVVNSYKALRDIINGIMN